MFTDKDLEELKKYIESHPSPPWDELLTALLERMEAAERCLIPATYYCVSCHCEDCESSRTAWKAAAGR